MFKKLTLALFAAFLAHVMPAAAQETPPAAAEEGDKEGNSPGPNRFWQATLPGGHYMVALDRIASISRHSYVLDGAVLVDEVTIDSQGQALARFYVLSPLTAEAPGKTAARVTERARELIDKAGERAGTDIHNRVVKKYPDTTHARTVEYRLLSEEQLTSLYKSIQTAWEANRGRKFTAK